MVDYYINFDRGSDLKGITKILDTIKKIEENDELVITMDNSDAFKSGFIRETLENKGFEILPKGDHMGEKYKLIVHKKKGD
ncbi:hypothetical protein Y919_08105 [Caloranaerobacter azorensis H53214]|uniref:Uncharacterized protein n=1 Tax=Caloranaerobacter azorensis H53214 TaxID=1156417 RepID=A0A096DLH7_9FIRM|nr:hypothetical protein [Caloranaerobacter azorensis]KGG80121.1 hypothetical protein Y919_08105 [Caloranaerobacter azorensis H53214]